MSTRAIQVLKQQKIGFELVKYYHEEKGAQFAAGATGFPLAATVKTLMVDLGEFVDARETMIPRLGMQAYADVMSAFATGERQINRAWSASVDGYVDEVRVCVADAHAHLTEARTLLLQARA